MPDVSARVQNEARNYSQLAISGGSILLSGGYIKDFGRHTHIMGWGVMHDLLSSNETIKTSPGDKSLAKAVKMPLPT